MTNQCDLMTSLPVTYLEEPFTARSPVMVPVAPPTPSTCGQASSNGKSLVLAMFSF